MNAKRLDRVDRLDVSSGLALPGRRSGLRAMWERTMDVPLAPPHTTPAHPDRPATRPSPAARSAAREFRIDINQLIAWDQPRGLMVEVVEGRVWLTQAGDDRDLVVGPHRPHVVTSPGKLVIQALEPSVVRVSRLK